MPFLLKAQDIEPKDNNGKQEKTTLVKKNTQQGDKKDAIKSKPKADKPTIKQVPKARKQPKPRIVKPKIKPKVIKVKPIKGVRLKIRKF